MNIQRQIQSSLEEKCKGNFFHICSRQMSNVFESRHLTFCQYFPIGTLF